MSSERNNYFVPGFGISRRVIQTEIRYHCGPEAIARPYTHQVRARDGALCWLGSGASDTDGNPRDEMAISLPLKARI